MNEESKIKLFHDVFAPKKDENILFIYDTPHDNIKDTEKWFNRRIMAKEWYQTFNKLGETEGYKVEILSYPATGLHGSSLPNDICKRLKESNIVIAFTEFSASHPLAFICKSKQSITRCASLPLVEKRMEKTAFKADYSLIQRYTKKLETFLNNTISAKVIFSTDDELEIDLRNRKACIDDGICHETGTLINLPSGESYIPPYEAASNEIKVFGKSKTNGILPDYFDDEIIKYHVKNNRITKIEGNEKKVKEREKFFNTKTCRRNIAELGIGCNPNAIVTGNPLEDEKVAGLHIAYGMSNSFGGNTKCDMHWDICFPIGAPVAAISLILIDKAGKEIELITKKGLQFNLL